MFSSAGALPSLLLSSRRAYLSLPPAILSSFNKASFLTLPSALSPSITVRFSIPPDETAIQEFCSYQARSGRCEQIFFFSHHAELRLQLNLQALECAPQVIDLCLGHLNGLCTYGHLFGQACRLERDTKTQLCRRSLDYYLSYFHKRLCLITGQTLEGVNPVICNVWDIMTLFMGKSFHLLIKPGLLVATMFVSDGFILGADLFQDFVEVLLGRSIHLHVDCASKLRPQCCQLLNNQEE